MKKKATLHPFLKMAGVKSEKELYDKYPTDEHFFKAYPQAKYGMMMAQDGAMTLPNAKPNVAWQPSGQGLSPADNVAGLNAAGPMPQQGGYQAAQGPVFEGQMPEQEQQKQEQPEGKENKKGNNKNKLKISAGKKTWDPFAKDNAWNTGKGVATTDVIAGGLAMTAGAMPFQPAKKNQDILPPAVTTGNYGYGSQASFEDGGNISPTKAREMLHNPPHGKPLSEKQRKYFGAIASGYADDGAKMAIGQLGQIEHKLNELKKVVTPDSEIEPWVASKVTLAADYLNNVGNYMQFNPDAQPQSQQQMQQPGMYMGGYLRADGGPMITHVKPSPYTYYRPMTKTNRQKMDMPDYMPGQSTPDLPFAANGINIPGVGGYQAPVTDQEREQWNQYQSTMSHQPGTYVRNWQHNQDFQKQMAQQTGFDYNRAGAIQADMQARSQQYPGSVSGIKPGATENQNWGGDANWVGDRERQKAYGKYEYLHYDPKGNLYPGEAGHKEASFTPMTKEQMGNWENSAYTKGPNQWVTNNQSIGMNAPQSEIDKLYQPGAQNTVSSAGGFGSNTPVASSTQPRTKAFPTMDQAKAAYAKKKAGVETKWNATSGEYEEVGKGSTATANVDNSGPGQEAYSIDATRRTGKGSDEAKYGKQMIPGMYHPDHDMEMLDQYPHKMGGMYKPYSHTYTMAQGGPIPFANGGNTGTDVHVEDSKFKMLSPHTAEIGGDYHSNGGTDIQANGQKVEAEKGETLHIQPDGSTIVGGNLYVPGTRTKFKDAFKDLAGNERKTAKVQDKASYFLNEYGKAGDGPTNQFRAPAFNYGKVMADAYEQRKAQNEQVKNNLTEVQNKMLELGGMIDPQHGAKKVSQMFKGKDQFTAKWGTRMAQQGDNLEWEWKPGSLYPSKPTIPVTDPTWHAPETYRTAKPGAVGTFDPNMDTGIIGEQPESTPYEFDPSKSGVIPEPKHPDWAYKPDGSKMTPEEMQKNLINRKKTKPEDIAKNKVKGLRNKFHVSDYLGEFATMFDQPEPVQSMQVQSYLEPEYNVSFQQKKNAIQSAFAPAMKAAKTSGQQAAIAAQMAEQLGAVDSEEFNFNQQNRGQIEARNLAEMRGVRDTNMKLGMDATAKTDAARENTRENRFKAAQSFGSKEAQRRAQNLSLGMEEEYAGWKYDPAFKDHWEMLHPDAVYDPRTVSIYDYESFKDTTKKKKSKTDSKGKKSEEETTTEESKYYGGPMAYFGDYFPGIQRVYFAGGAVSGGMGHGGGMHGMPGHTGSMASRYSPGGDTSYYEKKKKKKRVS